MTLLRQALPQVWVACARVLAVALPGTVQALDCAAPSIGLSAGRELSQWREVDARGSTVLTERGVLDHWALVASGHCPALTWEAQWAHSQGQRRYDGQTQTGTPVQTSSRLRVDALALSGWWPRGTYAVASPGSTEHTHPWAWGARLGWRQTDRRIGSTATAWGYPERFRAWQLALGVRWRVLEADSWRLSATGWAGGGPGGTAQIDLPNDDPLTLPLGRNRLLALGLQLDGGASGRPSAWKWQLRLDLQNEATAAGAAQAVTRNGVPVAVAWMPEIRQQQRRLTASLHRRF